jgi:RNA methyltransferase
MPDARGSAFPSQPRLLPHPGFADGPPEGYTGSMAIRDLASERLYVDADLSPGARVVLEEDQAHYLVNVLRLNAGARVLVFNGREGEWQAELTDVKKRRSMAPILNIYSRR